MDIAAVNSPPTPTTIEPSLPRRDSACMRKRVLKLLDGQGRRVHNACTFHDRRRARCHATLNRIAGSRLHGYQIRDKRVGEQLDVTQQHASRRMLSLPTPEAATRTFQIFKGGLPNLFSSPVESFQ